MFFEISSLNGVLCNNTILICLDFMSNLNCQVIGGQFKLSKFQWYHRKFWKFWHTFSDAPETISNLFKFFNEYKPRRNVKLCIMSTYICMTIFLITNNFMLHHHTIDIHTQNVFYKNVLPVSSINYSIL